MQTNTPRLRALMAEEAAGAEDLSPAGDAAVRAQLRFLAQALAANAAPGQDAELTAFAAGLGEQLHVADDRLADLEALMGEAAAFEAGKQFGTDAEGDPNLRETLARRVRVGAWLRLFLESMDAARPGRPPVAGPANAWMSEHQARLADTIFAIDRAAKQAELARGGPDAIASPDVVNRIGQAAMLQGHVRFLAEAVSRAI